MNRLWLDTETFSDVPITYGTHAYAERAEILLLAYAWNDDPVDVVEYPDAAFMQALIDAADESIIHNSHFDRTVLRWNGVTVPVEKIIDTMVLALAHSLPGSLDKLCDVLRVPTDKAKSKDGKRLIHLFTKPLGKNRKLARATKETHPEEWEDFKEYARLDVEAMRSAFARLPHWNLREYERGLWMLDQKINDRGLTVDTDLARSAMRAAKRAVADLAAQASEATDGAVSSFTQRDKTLEYLRGLGLETDDLKKGTVKALLEEDLSDTVRDLLEIRLQAASTSPTKYRTLLNGVSSDGKLRGTIQFCGAARTGRDAGRLFQPQNLPRPTLKQKDIDFGVAAMNADIEDLCFDNVMELCSSAVRGCIVAAPGKKLVVADLSNIEGRMLAFLAAEEWKLEAFRAFDGGVGHDLYKITAGAILHKDPALITKDERQVSGKVPELACGYGGSVGAFTTMGALYGVNLPEDRVLEIVKAWRKKHRNTVSLWYDCERAAVAAVKTSGEVFRAGKLAFKRDGAWLRMGLPSGRYLCYPKPEVDEDNRLSYEGMNQYTRRWERIETWGGKLVENADQGASRDIFYHGALSAEAAGYEVVGRVHDELICEVPDTAEFTSKGLSLLMATGPAWAIGLPLAASGFECYRYRKED